MSFSGFAWFLVACFELFCQISGSFEGSLAVLKWYSVDVAPGVKLAV